MPPGLPGARDGGTHTDAPYAAAPYADEPYAAALHADAPHAVRERHVGNVVFF